MAKNSSPFDINDSHLHQFFITSINEKSHDINDVISKKDLKGNSEEKVEEEQQDSSSKSKSNIGRWTEEEHEKFLKAIEIYGKSWNKVQTFIGTRTATQTRSHAQKYFTKISTLNNIKNTNEDQNQIVKSPKKRETKERNKIFKLDEISKKKESLMKEGNEETKIVIPLFNSLDQNFVSTSINETFNLSNYNQPQDDSDNYINLKNPDEPYEEISLEINGFFPRNTLKFPYENELYLGIDNN